MKLRIAKKVALARSGSQHTWHTITTAYVRFTRAARRGSRLITRAALAEVACSWTDEGVRRCGLADRVLRSECRRCLPMPF